ncbi:hypothetical protein CJD36_018305 [Flavipsychrobacter stenotrophus]|uniref:Uncharacterized protein n=1 Tax=Flavipsychrobacter stenotrophus TaxID=2077091 RepID=A0A2S7STF8_9BACT|nr:hypothetical protein [Flavipsychrobacter stenotrophus]PQJ09875.1 hypothetical protein CJD36_018305 [Flavipsychrobacter stenotrophus]
MNENDDRNRIYRVSYEIDKKNNKNRYLSKVYSLGDYYEGLFAKLESSDNTVQRAELERDIWGINLQNISKLLGTQFNKIIGARHISEQQLSFLKDELIFQKTEHDKTLTILDATEKKLDTLYPDKIFICEDEKGIELWRELLEKFEIKDVTVFSSYGCTIDDVEKVLLHKMKEKNGYSPIIYRELDRDGFMQNQIDIIEHIKSNKFKQFKKYKVKFLPVNEIENFAVLMDTFFDNELLKKFENYSVLVEKFRATVDANLIVAMKLCTKDIPNYKGITNYTVDKQKDEFKPKKAVEMKQTAEKDMVRLYPGKDIKKLKSNFNVDKLLRESDLTALPNELTDYLSDVKTFFEN